MAVTADNADRAAAVPVSAARQLRVSPMAGTMVKASTNSTPDARNVAVATPNVAALMCIRWLLFRFSIARVPCELGFASAAPSPEGCRMPAQQRPGH
jgi:hypothetical protein